MKPNCIYFNWEGRGYQPECAYHDIKNALEVLGAEGPIFATSTGDNDVVISTTPNPEVAYDLRNYKNGEFKDVVYEEWTSKCFCKVSELFDGEEFQVYENWGCAIVNLFNETDGEDAYTSRALRALEEHVGL